jgi:hypothetical protein
LPCARILETWRTDLQQRAAASWLRLDEPSSYAAARRSAALRSTDGFAAITAQV